MDLKQQVLRVINKLPYISKLHQENQAFRENTCYPAGHFYSPIISIAEIRSRQKEIWGKTDSAEMEGLALQTDKQLALVKQLTTYYDDIPFQATKQDKLRYYYENRYYSYTDGITLHTLIRHLKPARIIEIGSGFSSAVMLDTNEYFFNRQISLTFIEPNPERLFSIMTSEDQQHTEVIPTAVQNIPISLFKTLRAGDILFVDSSHVIKTGSDVHYILFEILPHLASGVFIHFHDIFYPFEYPEKWVYEGRNWNEAYFLKAFLLYNNQFEIVLFSDYLHKHHAGAYKGMSLCYQNGGGSLWIQKVTD